MPQQPLQQLPTSLSKSSVMTKKSPKRQDDEEEEGEDEEEEEEEEKKNRPTNCTFKGQAVVALLPPSLSSLSLALSLPVKVKYLKTSNFSAYTLNDSALFTEYAYLIAFRKIFVDRVSVWDK